MSAVSDRLGAALSDRYRAGLRTENDLVLARANVAASVVTTPTFGVTGRRDVFTRTRGNVFSYDVSPDGRQFVMAALPPEVLSASAAREREPMRLVGSYELVHRR